MRVGLFGGLLVLPWVSLLESSLPALPPAFRQSPAIQTAMQAITHLGLGWVDIGLFVALLTAGWWRRWPEGRRIGLYGALAVSGAGLLDQLLKQFSCRARPNAAEAGLFFAKFPCVFDGYAYSSFPSGHATTAFAAAAFLALWRPRLAIPAFLLAALVALSRVYLGAHFPSDVLAGALLGTSAAMAGWRWVERKGGGEQRTLNVER
ncbi:MAG: phosphatase PAP2 family protein [candidate division NC10 bacterium]|nr:phosphatase PAP2 family protein [candidate division NC10 bacterium]